MRLVNASRLVEFCEQHADAGPAVGRWRQVVLAARWRSPADLRRTFPNADAVRVDSGRTVTVFNIAGNSYRLLAAIDFNMETVNVLQLLTHPEYDRDRWKRTL